MKQVALSSHIKTKRLLKSIQGSQIGNATSSFRTPMKSATMRIPSGIVVKRASTFVQPQNMSTSLSCINIDQTDSSFASPSNNETTRPILATPKFLQNHSNGVTLKRVVTSTPKPGFAKTEILTPNAQKVFDFSRIDRSIQKPEVVIIKMPTPNTQKILNSRVASAPAYRSIQKPVVCITKIPTPNTQKVLNSRVANVSVDRSIQKSLGTSVTKSQIQKLPTVQAISMNNSATCKVNNRICLPKLIPLATAHGKQKEAEKRTCEAGGVGGSENAKKSRQDLLEV